MEGWGGLWNILSTDQRHHKRRSDAPPFPPDTVDSKLFALATTEATIRMASLLPKGLKPAAKSHVTKSRVEMLRKVFWCEIYPPPQPPITKKLLALDSVLSKIQISTTFRSLVLDSCNLSEDFATKPMLRDAAIVTGYGLWLCLRLRFPTFPEMPCRNISFK